MNRLRIALLAVAVAASAASVLSPDDPLPPTDDCDATLEPTVDSIDLVQSISSAPPLEDYQVHELISGFQGGTMIRLRMGLYGADLVPCMTFVMTYETCLDIDCVEIDPDTAFPDYISLETYEHLGGRITEDYLFQMRYPPSEGDLVRMTVAVGPEDSRMQTSVLMWMGAEGMLPEPEPDAGL